MESKRQPSAELSNAIDYLIALQKNEGCISGEVVWCTLMTAQYIIIAYITQQEISLSRKDKFIKYFQTKQTKHGGWGLHTESEPYVFTTTLTYIALRLLGVPAENKMCINAKARLIIQGGVLTIPTWGKFFLALLNLYQWEGINPILPELWILPVWFPFHPKQLYCHNRMITLVMSYLYGIKFQISENNLIKQIRNELYPIPYETIQFHQYRNAIAASDLHTKSTLMLKIIYRCFSLYEKYHSSPNRQKALSKIQQHIIYHQQQTNFVAFNPINGLLNTLVLYHTQHEDFLTSFRAMEYWFWEDEHEGLRVMGATSETWDTAFAVQALCDDQKVFNDKFILTPPHPPSAPSPLQGEGKQALQFLHNAYEYFKNAMMLKELPDYQEYYVSSIYGGFCFGDGTHRLPVSDCSGEALSAICLSNKFIEKEKQFSITTIIDIINYIISLQNKDGGWSSYDRINGHTLLKFFNPTEMFNDCMVDRSYVECTASCMQGLRHALDHYPELQRDEIYQSIDRALQKGAAFLKRKQQKDGSWPGAWGVNYIYGTFFGIIGLLASNIANNDPAVIKACEWLISKRLPDGGWGESWQGCLENRYIPHHQSQIIMTSWALIALIKANYQGLNAKQVIEEGVNLLKKRQCPNGDWPKESPAGVFFGNGVLEYTLYKNYFPLWALSLYEK